MNHHPPDDTLITVVACVYTIASAMHGACCSFKHFEINGSLLWIEATESVHK